MLVTRGAAQGSLAEELAKAEGEEAEFRMARASRYFAGIHSNQRLSQAAMLSQGGPMLDSEYHSMDGELQIAGFDHLDVEDVMVCTTSATSRAGAHCTGSQHAVVID